MCADIKTARCSDIVYTDTHFHRKKYNREKTWKSPSTTAFVSTATETAADGKDLSPKPVVPWKRNIFGF